MPGRDQGTGRFDRIRFARRLGTEDDPGDHPPHVCVEKRHVPLVGKRGDSSGRVGADAGKLLEIRRIVGKRAAELIDHRPCRALQIHGPPVVTESGPNADDVGRRGIGEVLDGWKSLQEPRVVGKHAIDLCLLEHDLRDEDRVGITGPPPGQVPSVLLEPSKQPVPDACNPGLLSLVRYLHACRYCGRRGRLISYRYGRSRTFRTKSSQNSTASSGGGGGRIRRYAAWPFGKTNVGVPNTPGPSRPAT